MLHGVQCCRFQASLMLFSFHSGDQTIYKKTLHMCYVYIYSGSSFAIMMLFFQVKELRNSGDETARIIVANQQEGLEPPEHLPRYFEHLLMLVNISGQMLRGCILTRKGFVSRVPSLEIQLCESIGYN